MNDPDHNHVGYAVCDITVGWHVPCVRSPVFRAARDADAHRDDMIAKGSRRKDYQVIDAKYLPRHAFGL